MARIAVIIIAIIVRVLARITVTRVIVRTVGTAATKIKQKQCSNNHNNSSRNHNKSNNNNTITANTKSFYQKPQVNCLKWCYNLRVIEGLCKDYGGFSIPTICVT